MEEGREEKVTNLTLAKKGEELAARDEIHHHVEVLRVLERAPEVDEERVSYPLEHLSLRVGMLDLLHLDDAFFRENLDRVRAVVVLRADEVDATERTGTEGADEGEVAEGVAGGGLAGHGGGLGRGRREDDLRCRVRRSRDLARGLRLVAVTVLLLLLLRLLPRRRRCLLPLLVVVTSLLLLRRRVVVSRTVHLDVVDAHVLPSAIQPQVSHLPLDLPLITVAVLVVPRRVLLQGGSLLLVPYAAAAVMIVVAVRRLRLRQPRR